MNILFIGYWGANEGLSVATIYPHLQILSNFSEVQKIVYASIERNFVGDGTPNSDGAGAAAIKSIAAKDFCTSDVMNVAAIKPIPKVIHIPLHSGNSLKHKFSDFWQFPRQLAKICQTHQIDVMICRGAPAGSLGYLVHQKNKLPFHVESFEPHAQYMLESGVWKSYDLRYVLQKHWEKKQKQYAQGLIPVAENYRRQLIKEGVKAKKIKTMPCAVDLTKFTFHEQARTKMRAQLGIPAKAVVSIYVGKYGGLYMDDEAFQLYQVAFKLWQDFHLIILSPAVHHEHIRAQLANFQLPVEKMHVAEVAHEQVADYLSASDFAFATYRPGKSKKYLSPIKVGEYWANGLPIMLTEGVGDDSSIIREEGGGAIFDVKDSLSISLAFEKIYSIIEHTDYRISVVKLAEKYRSFDRTTEAYHDLLF